VSPTPRINPARHERGKLWQPRYFLHMEAANTSLCNQGDGQTQMPGAVGRYNALVGADTIPKLGSLWFFRFPWFFWFRWNRVLMDIGPAARRISVLKRSSLPCLDEMADGKGRVELF
jgi:hypothetical protein